MKTVIIVLSVITFSCSAFAQMMPGMMHGIMQGRIMKKGLQQFPSDKKLMMIGVDAKVRAEIRKVIHEAKKKLSDIRFASNEERIKLKAEYQKEKLNNSAIDTAIKRIADLQREKTELILTTKKAILTKLSLEERKRLLNMKQAMRPQRRSMMK